MPKVSSAPMAASAWKTSIVSSTVRQGIWELQTKHSSLHLSSSPKKRKVERPKKSYSSPLSSWGLSTKYFYATGQVTIVHLLLNYPSLYVQYQFLNTTNHGTDIWASTSNWDTNCSGWCIVDGSYISLQYHPQYQGCFIQHQLQLLSSW